MNILSQERDITAFVERFKDRLAGTDTALPDSVAAKIEKVFGERLTAVQVVRQIVDDVRLRGDDALCELTAKIDGVNISPSDLRVGADEISRASMEIPGELANAIGAARDNIARFQQAIAPEEVQAVEGGERSLGLRFVPLQSAGVYAPGGRAPYPSTVLMCAVPASVAGVERIAVVTPPGEDGFVNKAVLAACASAGVTEVYRVGGAQAVAALACGTETIPRVDKIVGPGNIFVTLAKKEILGQAGIDMLCGPSEIVVVADSGARPDFVAADMLGQAEHGPMAGAVAVTTSRKQAEAIMSEISKQISTLDRREIAEESLAAFGGIIVVENVGEALEMANRLAPEHMELMIENAADMVGRVRNAGAVFVGPYTPEVIGDYTAGPSHVLPTGGSARFFSGLSVYDFMRRFSVMEFSEKALRAQADLVRALAAAEGLTAHLRSLEIRLGE